jgi:hypothetical protein
MFVFYICNKWYWKTTIAELASRAISSEIDAKKVTLIVFIRYCTVLLWVSIYRGSRIRVTGISTEEAADFIDTINKIPNLL